MSRTLYLAFRYLVYYKVKATVLTICLTLTIVLPLSTHLVIEHYDRSLRARAAETPLIIGAKGNRFDLVLKSLYFSRAEIDPVYWSDYEALADDDLSLPIPVDATYTASGFPVVGTSLEYFDFRGLRIAAGEMFVRIGQAVIGAEAARTLKLGPGDTLFTDQQTLFDITQSYPLKLHITGVLEPRGTPDDHAVFVDIKTTWIIAGISHGHGDVAQAEHPGLILSREGSEIRTTDAIVEYNEVTDENVDSFHTHAPADRLPLTGIVVLPKDRKAETILKARYREPNRTTQMLEPAEVVSELMERVFEVQRIFNAAFALVAVSTGLFLALVILLSQRLRAREMETMWKLGASRGRTAMLQLAELGMVLVSSTLLASAIAAGVALVAPGFIGL